MAFCFGDGFDLYAAPADSTAGYWDSGNIAFTLGTGRFTGSRALSPTGSSATIAHLQKSSGSNDAVHHLSVAIQQTVLIANSFIYYWFTLSDGATAQCTVAFRQDGAILLISGASNGTTLATYTGAVTTQNQWYQFEFEVVINNTAGSFTVRRGGSTSNDFFLGSLNTRGGTANNYAARLTVGTGSGSGQLIDDLLWRSDASSVAWVGDVRCYTRMPVSDAAVQFTPSASAYPQIPFAGTTAPVAITANQARYSPFTPKINGTIGSVVVNLSTASTGNVKCAIYTNSGGAPGTVLATSGTVSAPPIGASTYTFSSPPTITGGTVYWLGVNGDTASGQWTLLSGSTVAATQTGATFASWPTNNPTGLTTLQAPSIVTINISQASGFINAPFVSEAQQDGATSYVFDSTVADADFYNIAAIAVTPASIVAVTTRGFIQKSDAGGRSGAVQLKSGGTTVASTTTAALTTFAWMWRTDTVDPATSAAWTPTAVNNVTIGPLVVS